MLLQNAGKHTMNMISILARMYKGRSDGFYSTTNSCFRHLRPELLQGLFIVLTKNHVYKSPVFA